MRGIDAEWAGHYERSVALVSSRSEARPLGPRGGETQNNSAGLHASLAALAESDPAALGPGAATQEHWRRYELQLATFRREKKRFSGSIKVDMARIDKTSFPRAYRQLKLLHAHLEAIQTRLERHYDTRGLRAGSPGRFDRSE